MSGTKSSTRGSAPKRRWYQFGLRSLLLVVCLLSVGLALWTTCVGPYRSQRQVMDTVKALGGTYQTEAAGKWLRRLYGDDFRNVILVDLADCPDPEAYLAQVATLPRLQTLVVGGPKFTDQELRRLRGMETLRWLVLDCTNVTDRAAKALQRSLPNLVVHKSRRLHIDAVRRLGGAVGCRPSYLHAQLCLLVGKRHFQDVQAVELTVDNFGADVSDADLVHLKLLPNLEELHLSDQIRVTDAGLVHLQGLSELEHLRLDGTRVTDAGLAYLKGLTKLRKLWLGGGTQVTDEGVKQLQQALPSCTIHCP